MNSAYLTPPYQITALGPPDLYDRLSASAGFVDFVRGRSKGYGIRRLAGGAGRRSTCRPSSGPSPCATRGRSRRRRPSPSALPSRARAADHASPAQPDSRIAAVALILGLLVVIQLRSQAASSGLAQLSSQDLTSSSPTSTPATTSCAARVVARGRARDADREPVARRRVGRRDRGRPATRPGVRRARPGRRSRRHDLDPRPDRWSRASRSSSTSCATRAPRRSRPAASGSSPGVVVTGAPGEAQVDGVGSRRHLRARWRSARRTS